MAGSSVEQGRQSPLLHLGERFFGHGRRFGIQRGTLAERIEDPFYSDIQLVAALSNKGMRVTQSVVSTEEERRIVERLSEQINKGTGLKRWYEEGDLIFFFDHQLAQTGMALAHDHRYATYPRLLNKYSVPHNLAELDPEEIQRIINLSIAPIAQEIISGAHTLQSIPYLQRALESRFAYRGSKLAVREESLFEPGEALATKEEWGWDREYLVTTCELMHNLYEITDFEAINPLMQAATETLERIAVDPDISSTLQAEAKNLLPWAHRIPKIAHYRRLIDSQPTGRTTETAV